MTDISIIESLQQAAQQMEEANCYFGHGTDNAWDEAIQLLCFIKGWGPIVTKEMADDVLSPSEQTDFNHLVQQRITLRVPAAYLTGKAWFAGFEFIVNSSVLVPRSPMAELIQNQLTPWFTETPRAILDLCTGSGCIGIAAAHYFSEAAVDLADISTEALAVADMNREQHQLNSRVNIIESDLFSNTTKRYDIIFSNPPYVDTEDMAQLPDEYINEPELGLTGGNDGLDLVAIILAEAANHLTDNGLLIVEVGNSFEALERCYPQVSFLWPEFESGGFGIFILDAPTLRIHQQMFIQAAYNRALK